jgi:hypothetical protein
VVEFICNYDMLVLWKRLNLKNINSASSPLGHQTSFVTSFNGRTVA